MSGIRICLWFNDQAEEAARFYVDLFGGHIETVARYGEAGAEMSGQQEGDVMTVAFSANGQEFLGLNGGPMFTFSEAISLVVECDTQERIDQVWSALTADGGEESMCGWCRDRFGVSWQVVPDQLARWMRDGTPEQTNRLMAAVGPMRKLDMATLEAAWKGEPAHA